MIYQYQCNDKEFEIFFCWKCGNFYIRILVGFNAVSPWSAFIPVSGWSKSNTQLKNILKNILLEEYSEEYPVWRMGVLKKVEVVMWVKAEKTSVTSLTLYQLWPNFAMEKIIWSKSCSTQWSLLCCWGLYSVPPVIVITCLAAQMHSCKHLSIEPLTQTKTSAQRCNDTSLISTLSTFKCQQTLLQTPESPKSPGAGAAASKGQRCMQWWPSLHQHSSSSSFTQILPPPNWQIQLLTRNKSNFDGLDKYCAVVCRGLLRCRRCPAGNCEWSLPTSFPAPAFYLWRNQGNATCHHRHQNTPILQLFANITPKILPFKNLFLSSMPTYPPLHINHY